MRLSLAVFIGFFACSTAMATVYEWVDNKGVINLTDNPDNVPAIYRKTMKTREIDINDETPAPVKQDAQSPAGQTPQAAGTENYGGHDEVWWRSQFEQLKTRIDDLKDDIDDKKKTLEELHRKRVLYQKPGDRVAYNQLADEIARDEETAKGLKKSLDDLTYQADGARVPLDWR
jgi:hypothetical protein